MDVKPPKVPGEIPVKDAGEKQPMHRRRAESEVKTPKKGGELGKLNKPIEAALEAKDPEKALGNLRGEIDKAVTKVKDTLTGKTEVTTEIPLEQVQHLMKKPAKDLDEQEKILLSSYYIQKAEKLADKGTTEGIVGAIMFRIKALFLQISDLFGATPEVAEIKNDTSEDLAKIPTEGPEFSEAHRKKVQDTENAAKAIEYKDNIPASVIVAIAAIEGDCFLNANARTSVNTFGTRGEDGELIKYKNMQECFDDFAKRTNALMKDSGIGRNKPIEYLAEYVKRKLKKEGKSEEAIAQGVKDYLQRSNTQLTNLYEKNELSTSTYHGWSTNLKASMASLEKDYKIEPEKMPIAKLRASEIVDASKLSPKLRKKLGTQSAWFQKSCKHFNVDPNVVGGLMRVECNFNYDSINTGSRAQGAAQMMPKYVTAFLRRFKPHMDRMPELQHARGKGTKIIYKGELQKASAKGINYQVVEDMGRHVKVRVLSHEYDVFDPKVGIFIAAAFVAQHQNGLRKHSSKLIRHFGKPFDQLDQKTKDMLTYMRHNPGPNGMWKWLERGKMKGAKVARYAAEFRAA